MSAAAALLVSAGFTFTLPVEYFTVGGIVAVLVAAYFGLVHLLKPNTVTAGREGDAGWPAFRGRRVRCRSSRPANDIVRWLPATAGFGVICWLNCRVIDRWEGDVTGDDTREPSLGITAVVLASLVPRPVAFAFAAAAALLLAVHLAEPKIGPRVARAGRCRSAHAAARLGAAVTLRPNFDALAPHYRWIETAAFGSHLQWCRTALMPDAHRATRTRARRRQRPFPGRIAGCEPLGGGGRHRHQPNDGRTGTPTRGGNRPRPLSGRRCWLPVFAPACSISS